jgi:hypothetical protein
MAVQHTSTLRQLKKVIPTSCRSFQGPAPVPRPVLVLKPLRPKPRRFPSCCRYHFIVPCPYFRALFWPNEFWLSVFLEAGQGALKTLSGEIWIAALRRWAIARDGRAVEVGPLRLLVVPPGLVEHSFASN